MPLRLRAGRSTQGSGPGDLSAAPASERAAEQRASGGKVIRDAAEAQHVPGERVVAGGDRFSQLLLDPLDDARHAQAGAGNEDGVALGGGADVEHGLLDGRSEEHTSELQSLMRSSYAVFCLKKK